MSYPVARSRCCRAVLIVERALRPCRWPPPSPCRACPSHSRSFARPGVDRGAAAQVAGALRM
eukprot:scaffold2175_cov241-Pinguiococcus_pyrenoidosus.AAC.2